MPSIVSAGKWWWLGSDEIVGMNLWKTGGFMGKCLETNVSNLSDHEDGCYGIHEEGGLEVPSTPSGQYRYLLELGFQNH
jgi:hypothetical protein